MPWNGDMGSGEPRAVGNAVDDSRGICRRGRGGWCPIDACADRCGCAPCVGLALV